MNKLYQIVSLLVISACSSFGQVAESYIAVERHSKRVLLAANTEQVLPLGRFSQLATVKVALDWAKASGTSLATPLLIPHGVNVNNNPLSLQGGDTVTLRDLIYSISMSNDESSAVTVADFVGRQLQARRGSGGSSLSVFVAEMNTLGASLKMSKTKFTSPFGPAVSGGVLGTTTVSDLAKLTIGLLNTHGFEFYTKQQSRRLTISRVNGTKQTLTVVNNNKLIGKQGITGVKASGNQSVIAANKQPYKEKLETGQVKITPVQMVVISLNSSNRDERVRQLIATGWQQYEAWRASGYVLSPERKEFLH